MVLEYVITTMIVQTNLMNVPIDQNAMIENLEIAKDESIDLRYMMNLNAIVRFDKMPYLILIFFLYISCLSWVING